MSEIKILLQAKGGHDKLKKLSSGYAKNIIFEIVASLKAITIMFATIKILYTFATSLQFLGHV